MALSARDLRKVIEIIDVIYSVPDNHAMFRAVCEKLQKLIGVCSGVIAIEEDGRTLFVNDMAKRLLKGIPIESIPNPGLGSNPVFFKSKSGAYRVRAFPLGRDGKGRVVLVERYPPEHRLHPKLADFKLSRRESDIAVYVVQGYSNREIAELSFICEQTVKDHLHAIFEKLEVRSRGELTAKVLGLRTVQKPL